MRDTDEPDRTVPLTLSTFPMYWDPMTDDPPPITADLTVDRPALERMESDALSEAPTNIGLEADKPALSLATSATDTELARAVAPDIPAAPSTRRSPAALMQDPSKHLPAADSWDMA